MSSITEAPEGLNPADAAEIAADWVSAFAEALASGEVSELESLFTELATWRDFMAFQWDVSNRMGRDALVPRLLELSSGGHSPADLALTPIQDPIVYEGNIQAFFDFTDERPRLSQLYVFLIPHDGGFVASTLQTQADSLKDFPMLTNERRPDGKQHGLVMNRTRWTDDRAEEREFEHSDPAVVVLGAGHN